MYTTKHITAVACLLAAAICLMPLKPEAQIKKSGQNSPIKNIVLVHGAFADGSSWSKTIAILLANNYKVIAVQNPLTSLEEDIAATKRAIALMDGPVLLVGHSYGGVVITAAGNDPKVAGLVYVCALIPNDNQSVMDITRQDPDAPGSKEIKPDESGFLSLTYKGVHSFFAQDLPSQERDIIYATQTPWAAIATTTKIKQAAWKRKPSWCIIGLGDHMVTPKLATAEAKMLHAKTLELQSGHVPMISRPKQVADFIMDAASH